jgi:hypothetical protein
MGEQGKKIDEPSAFQLAIVTAIVVNSMKPVQFDNLNPNYQS